MNRARKSLSRRAAILPHLSPFVPPSKAFVRFV